MRRALALGSLALLVATILVLTLVSPSAASGSQLWVLSDDNHSEGSGTKVMYRNGSAGNAKVKVDKGGGCVVWLADEAALCDVTISGGAWYLRFTVDPSWNWYSHGEVAIGIWDDAGNTFSEITTATVFEIKVIRSVVEIEWQQDPATIPDGDFLALKVTNTDPQKEHKIIVGGSAEPLRAKSLLGSPRSDPGYPVPELPTALLLGVGLAVVGGVGTVVMVRRRKLAS